MKGNETFKGCCKDAENLVARTLEENKLKASQISPSYTSKWGDLRIIQATALLKRLNIPMEKVFVNIDK